MSKKNYYKIGHISNPLNVKIGKITVGGKSCKIVVPARVNTFLCHHNFFVDPPKPQIYPVNSINFTISKFTEVVVTIRNEKGNIINAPIGQKAIIEHAIKIMQKTLKIEIAFEVKAKNLHGVSHGGLGSSSAIMSAIAQAINILMGNVLSIGDITKLISQNYGEESNKKGFLSPAASIGGSTAAALSGKSLIVMGGRADIWSTSQLPKEYYAILLYPKKIKPISKVQDNKLNKKEVLWLKNIDRDWGDFKENMLKEKIVPAINRKDYSVLFKAINMYTIGAYGDIPQYFRSRWISYGFPYDLLIFTIFSKLFNLLKIEENCFFVSSNGPMIVVITKYPQKVQELLKDLDKEFTIEKVALSKTSNYKLTK